MNRANIFFKLCYLMYMNVPTEQNYNKIIHLLNRYNNYNIDSKICSDVNDMASLTNKYYDTMTIEDINQIIHKYMSENEMRRMILRHELKFLKMQPKYLELQQFKKEALHILRRYQYHAGGFNMDDREWIVHDKTSTRYDIHEMELVFENTIHMDHIKDTECAEYIQLIINRLNMMATNVKVVLHSYLSDRDQIYYILLKCNDISTNK